MSRIPRNPRNFLSVMALLELSSCTLLRTLRKQHWQPSEMASVGPAGQRAQLAIMKFPVGDPQVYRQAIRDQAAHQSPFCITLRRPYVEHGREIDHLGLYSRQFRENWTKKEVEGVLEDDEGHIQSEVGATLKSKEHVWDLKVIGLALSEKSREGVYVSEDFLFPPSDSDG
ncbi:hypothetical protein DL98DRAFT_537725 [Cadophora sp. DSE1049]|nr:hypothetical protein DL98DRAFT_537725 [Cadophora sp. DSE1049]